MDFKYVASGKKNPEPELVSFMRSSEMWNSSFKSSFGYGMGYCPLWLENQNSLNSQHRALECSVPDAIESSVCLLPGRDVFGLFDWNLGLMKLKQLENSRQKVSNGYFSVQPLCGGWSELAARSVASVEISIAFIQSCFNASS